MAWRRDPVFGVCSTDMKPEPGFFFPISCWRIDSANILFISPTGHTFKASCSLFHADVLIRFSESYQLFRPKQPSMVLFPYFMLTYWFSEHPTSYSDPPAHINLHIKSFNASQWNLLPVAAASKVASRKEAMRIPLDLLTFLGILM